MCNGSCTLGGRTVSDEYIKALEHWAKCFRSGLADDQFADEIAYLLEDKAHDLKLAKQEVTDDGLVSDERER
jgi:hypothetical protein